MRKLFFVILFLLSAQFSFAQFNTNRIMAIGRNALYFEDYVLSIQYFNRVINVKPYLADPYYYRAIAKFYLDDLIGSANDCEIATNINPFLVSAYNLHGIIMLRLGRSDEALEDFNHGLSLEGDDISLLMNHGIAQINLKNYDRAIEDYNEILKRDSKNIAAILYRGIAYVCNGDTLTALSEFDRATKLNKYSPDAYTYLASVHYQMAHYDSALVYYNRLVELRPLDANIYVNRAITYYNLDNYNQAFADLDEAIRLDSKNDMALTNRGILRAEVGEYEKAIQDFSNVLRIDPTNEIVIFNRAILYIEVQQYLKAEQDLDIIIASHPDFGPAYYYRSLARDALGKKKEAELDMYTAREFEAERTKQALARGENPDQDNNEPQDDDKDKNKKGGKKDSRSKNDRSLSKYNQYVVVADFEDNDDKLVSQESIRGKVQMRDVAVDLEPCFELSFFTADTLLPKAHYFKKSVEKFNNEKNFDRKLLITNREYTAEGTNALMAFNRIQEMTEKIDAEPANYNNYLIRSSLYSLTMNYTNAINDLSVVILKNPLDINALFMRAAFRFKSAEMLRSLDFETNPTDVSLGNNNSSSSIDQLPIENQFIDYDLIVKDLLAVLEIDPEFEFAYYNLALIYCLRKQYDLAVTALNQAIEINKDFAEAYFNRGIIRIYLGEEKAGIDDLSQAGELGLYKAYNVIKKYSADLMTDE